MLADLEGTVRKIGEFLGGTAARLVENENTLERIVAESRLDAMKQNQGRWFPGSALSVALELHPPLITLHLKAQGIVHPQGQQSGLEEPHE